MLCPPFISQKKKITYMIRWNGKDYSPRRYGKAVINQSIEELMKPLSEKKFKGNVWRAHIIGDVQPTSSAEPVSSPTPTPSNTATQTPTPTVTQTNTPTTTGTLTPTPTNTATNTPSPTPSPQPVLWVASNGNQEILGYSITSSATTWTRASVDTPLTAKIISGLAYNGSRWSAAGFQSLTTRGAWYSDNGYNWTFGQNISGLFDTNIREVAANNSVWLIGGDSSYNGQVTGATTMAYSYDGITYSATNISVQAGRAKPSSITAFVYNGSTWLAGGSSTGTTGNRTVLLNSEDGVNWSGITNTLFTGTTSINSLAYGNGIWVASSNIAGLGKLAASTDGVNWTASTNASSATLFSGITIVPNNVIFFDNKFVATSGNVSGATYHLIIYSTDGLTWSACTDTKTLIPRGILHIASNGNVLIATSTTGTTGNTATTYISNNGINWSANTSNINTIFTGATSLGTIASNVPIQPSPNTTPTPTPTTTSTQTPTPTLTQTPTPTSSPAPPFDADAAAYLASVLTEGGTLNSTISAATNTLYTELKSAGLYSKLSVFYPFVGGTSASHAIMGNRTSGTTYDITWGGGMSHSVSGITGNGSTTSYGTTNFFSNSQTLGDRHYSLYSFINNTGAAYDLAVEGDNGIILGFGGNQFYPLLDGTSYFNYNASDTMGMYVVSETTLNNHYGYKNGVEVAFAVRTSASYNRAFDIGGVNRVPLTPNHGAQSSRGYNWASIGFGLTSGDTANLSTIINTFQTTLGRNTY
jgi:hypothetical protein